MSKATSGRLTANEAGQVTIQALSDIDLFVGPGDRLGIIGPNGSGKSTLLRLLAGIYEPSSGSAIRSGTIGSLVDINMGINPENTGIENIILRGKLLGLGHRQIVQRLDEIVEFSELGDFISLPVRTYSSGMLLRLAFAVSTSITADIIIMDEWLSVGDGAFAKKAESRLANLVKNSELLIIATHNRALAEAACNKAIWLEQGRIKLSGEAKAVSKAYFG